MNIPEFELDLMEQLSNGLTELENALEAAGPGAKLRRYGVPYMRKAREIYIRYRLIFSLENSLNAGYGTEEELRNHVLHFYKKITGVALNYSGSVGQFRYVDSNGKFLETVAKTGGWRTSEKRGATHPCGNGNKAQVFHPGESQRLKFVFFGNKMSLLILAYESLLRKAGYDVTSIVDSKLFKQTNFSYHSKQLERALIALVKEASDSEVYSPTSSYSSSSYSELSDDCLTRELVELGKELKEQVVSVASEAPVKKPTTPPSSKRRCVSTTTSPDTATLPPSSVVEEAGSITLFGRSSSSSHSARKRKRSADSSLSTSTRPSSHFSSSNSSQNINQALEEARDAYRESSLTHDHVQTVLVAKYNKMAQVVRTKNERLLQELQRLKEDTSPSASSSENVLSFGKRS